MFIRKEDHENCLVKKLEPLTAIIAGFGISQKNATIDTISNMTMVIAAKVVAMVGATGVIIAAIINGNYLIRTTQIPIETTETAQARLTTIPNTALSGV